jgi:hypothetical protein
MNVADMHKRKGTNRRDSHSPSEFGVRISTSNPSSPQLSKSKRRANKGRHSKGPAPRGVSSDSFPSPSHFEPEPTARTILTQNGRLEQACSIFNWLEDDGTVSDRFLRLSPEHVRHEIIRRTELTISAGVVLYLYSTKERDSKKKTDKDLERRWKVHELRAINMKYELELRKDKRRIEDLESALLDLEDSPLVKLPEEARKHIAHILGTAGNVDDDDDADGGGDDGDEGE